MTAGGHGGAHTEGWRLVDARPGLRRYLAGGWGVIYSIVGVVGLAVAGFEGSFFARAGETVASSIRVNTFQNLVHIALGVYGLIACTRDTWSVRYSRVLFKVSILLFALGVWSESNAGDNYIGGNGYTTSLHLISAIFATI